MITTARNIFYLFIYMHLFTGVNRYDTTASALATMRLRYDTLQASSDAAVTTHM